MKIVFAGLKSGEAISKTGVYFVVVVLVGKGINFGRLNKLNLDLGLYLFLDVVPSTVSVLSVVVQSTVASVVLAVVDC